VKSFSVFFINEVLTRVKFNPQVNNLKTIIAEKRKNSIFNEIIIAKYIKLKLTYNVNKIYEVYANLIMIKC
jgi:hypothetical protein